MNIRLIAFVVPKGQNMNNPVRSAGEISDTSSSPEVG